MVVVLWVKIWRKQKEFVDFEHLHLEFVIRQCFDDLTFVFIENIRSLNISRQDQMRAIQGKQRA